MTNEQPKIEKPNFPKPKTLETGTSQDYSKYEKITNRILNESSDLAKGLQDTMMRAWAEQTNKNKDDHSNGFGKAIFGSLDSYVRETVYGITKPAEANDDYKTLETKLVETAIGFDQSNLDKVYRGKKEIHAGDLEQFVEKGMKSVSETVQSAQLQRLEKLDDQEKIEFKSYVLELAKEVGSDLKTESMLTPEMVVKTYRGLLGILAQKRNTEKAAKLYKGPMDAANDDGLEMAA